jgi:dephospho-CoA kinase
MGRDSDKVLRIGLTGGIASGKSLIANCFNAFGIPVIDTDVIARDVVKPGQPALDEIREQFGAAVLTADGHLDRRAMRELAFDDAAQRKRLEAILHPRIQHAALERSARAGGPYQVLVVPLLVESGFNQFTDRVLVADCPSHLQASRLRARDGEDPARIERILATQLSREERLRAADDVIDNSGSVESTLAQVEALHERYLAIARTH